MTAFVSPMMMTIVGYFYDQDIKFLIVTLIKLTSVFQCDFFLHSHFISAFSNYPFPSVNWIILNFMGTKNVL